MRVPSLIKRNTALFALSQSFTGTGMQFAYGLGPLMFIALTQSAHWAGLSVVLLGLSRFLVAYPVGKITDAYGRKPGILLGLVLAMVGGVMTGWSMNVQSVPLLVGGMLIFGMGMYANAQMRVAATDMFPPRLRGIALGYVMMGSTVGVLISPLFVIAGESLAHRFGGDPLGAPWLLLPFIILPGMLMISFVRPDPKEIGSNLERYYPEYTPPPASPGKRAADFSARELLQHIPSRLAIIANGAAYGNMAIVMVFTSLVLQHHGHSLGYIAFAHSLHAFGMFGLSIPVGKLADRFGRGRVMYPGVALTLVGAFLTAFTDGYWSITFGSFLVGLGWSAANIAATATIADFALTAQRGRAIGVNDSVAGAVNVVVALVTGPMIQWLGLTAAGVAAVVFAALPLAMRFAYRPVKAS